MGEPEQFFVVVVALAVAVILAAFLLELVNGQPVEADEEAEQAAPWEGFKQSEHYRDTWARVREYIDGWKHVNNGR